MSGLEGKTAILTGTTGGLGPYVARALAGRGVRLALAGRDPARLEARAEELRASGTAVALFAGDLTRAEDRERLVRAAEDAFGRVDVLVNNAGEERMRHFHRLAPHEVERMVAINLTAPLLLAQRLIPGMLERGWGRIVNIASLAGKSPPPFAVPYAATKAGVIAFTRSLRAEYRGTGVSASTVTPGFVRDAGMYQRAVEVTGRPVSPLLGTARPEAVGHAVVRALETDAAEIIVNPGPIRLLAALAEVFPDLGGWVGRRIRVERVLGAWADRHDAEEAAP